ncbi:MAG: ATPase, T2SS/T4P/T4SS family, partial [Clostridia bacterium]|nr:ATPase, T2SS/T4P/T4SS family [Clostridia bacterium]
VINAYMDEETKSSLKTEIIKILDTGSYYYTGGRNALIKGIFNFMFGYGALQRYVDDDDVSDIDGTAYNQFSITKNGVRQSVDIDFGDEDSFGTYCRLIAVRSGGILNEDDTHCRTADLSRKLRINVSIPPRNVSGPAISIRKHRKKAYAFDDLVKLGMMDNGVAELLRKTAGSSESLLISGKGASGKTTLMRTLINSLPELERVLVVESDAEIYPEKRFCIEQRIKRASEGGQPVTLEMLVRDGLTMSLDAYCIGEIVGEEAYSFIKASCSGHRVLGTIHSGNAAGTLPRLVSLASGSRGAEPAGMLMRHAISGISTIVHMERFRVVHILRVKGIDGDKPAYEELYRRKAS